MCFFLFVLLMRFSPRDINILTGLIEPLEVSLCFAWQGKGAEVSAGTALLDVRNHVEVRVISYPKDTFMFRTLTALPAGPCTVCQIPDACTAFMSLYCCFSRCWVDYSFSLEWELSICIFRPWVQERQTGRGSCVIDPSWISLCRQHNLRRYVTNAFPQGISKLPTSTAADTWARASLAMPAVLDVMEPVRWSETLPWVLKTSHILQHKQTGCLWAMRKRKHGCPCQPEQNRVI